MALFREVQHGYIGIDIGVSSIKLVEAELHQAVPRLRTYAVVNASRNIVKENDPAALEYVAEAIRQARKRGRFQSNKAVAAIPNVAVFQSLLALPRANEKQLQQQVLEAARKIVPLPLDKVSMDWKVVDFRPLATVGNQDPAAIHKQTQTVRVFLTAAPRSVVERYVRICAMAKLDLLSLETQATSLARVLVGNDRSTVLICDIGHHTSDLMLVSQGVATMTRSVEVGGEQVTSHIGQMLGMDVAAAEQFKKDLASSPAAAGATGNALPPFIAEVLAPLMTEVDYLLQESGREGYGSPEKIILTGGSAALPGLDRHFSQKFKVPTFVGDPWSRISYPADLRLTLAGIGPAAAIAIGCALRELNPT